MHRLFLTGINSKGDKSPSFKLPEKWKFLIKAPFKISEQCCDVMKKRPLHAYYRDTSRVPFTGEMAENSQTRRRVYLKQGCNAFSSKVIKSSPMAFWMTKDVWAYIKLKGLPYSSIYDMGHSNTGCAFCMFGADQECSPNRFQLMEKTHPKLHKYCLDDLELMDKLEYLGIEYTERQLELPFDTDLLSPK